MKNFLFIFLYMSGLFISSAQTNPNWEYWTSNRLEVKRGMSAEFEKAASLKNLIPPLKLQYQLTRL